MGRKTGTFFIAALIGSLCTSSAHAGCAGLGAYEVSEPLPLHTYGLVAEAAGQPEDLASWMVAAGDWRAWRFADHPDIACIEVNTPLTCTSGNVRCLHAIGNAQFSDFRFVGFAQQLELTQSHSSHWPDVLAISRDYEGTMERLYEEDLGTYVLSSERVRENQLLEAHDG